MTPRETLLAAAERLEKLVAGATPGPWRASSTGEPFGADVASSANSIIALHCLDANAELIATLNPLVAAGLAQLFRGAADVFENECAMAVEYDVLALAQLVLGGE